MWGLQVGCASPPSMVPDRSRPHLRSATCTAGATTPTARPLLPHACWAIKASTTCGCGRGCAQNHAESECSAALTSTFSGRRRRPLPAGSTRLRAAPGVGRRAAGSGCRSSVSAGTSLRRPQLALQRLAPARPAAALHRTAGLDFLRHVTQQVGHPLRRPRLLGEEPPSPDRGDARAAGAGYRVGPPGLPAHLRWRRARAWRGRIAVRAVRPGRTFPRFQEGPGARSGVRKCRRLRLPELVSN